MGSECCKSCCSANPFPSTIMTKEISSIETIVQKIREEIARNKDVYNSFLDCRQLLHILSTFHTRFMDSSTSMIIINMILDYLSYCKTAAGGHPPLPTTFTQQYAKELAQRWTKLREESYFFNKSHLKILSYIVEEPVSEKFRYKGCFQRLKFDLSEQECKQVATDVQEMAKEDMKSFCFLSNYLLLSCKRLESSGTPLAQISKHFIGRVQMLSSIFKAAPEIQGEDKQLQMHQTFRNEELIPKIEINLSGEQNSKQILNNFIMQRAEESSKQFNRFVTLMKEICQKNDGFRFKANLKISSKDQHNALLRIKEKMLSSLYTKTQLKRAMDVSTIDSSSTIKGSYSKEKQAYEVKMMKMFQNFSGPIPFKVDDMLRGKCLFVEAYKINKCCSDILQALKKDENKDLKVMQIKNRLKTGTSDLVLRIVFGSVIAELQLAINFSSAENEFNHKLYELTRAMFFSPLTELSMVNQKITREYVSEVKALVQANTSADQQNYEEYTTYREVQTYFDDFVKILPLTIVPEKPTFFPEFQNLKIEQENLKRLTQCMVGGYKSSKALSQIKLQQGRYFFLCKYFEKALISLKEGLKCAELEQNSIELEEEIKKILSRKAEIIEIQANIFKCQGKDSKALECLQNSLNILEGLKGKSSLDLVTILNSIGLIKNDMAQFKEALSCFNRCLEIEEDLIGKDCIQTAPTLNNLGNVYQKKKDYSLAIESYEKCLSIYQLKTGESSIDTATALNNIGLVYEDLGNYSKAIEYYSKSIEIQQKLKGIFSIDVATSLSNIGSVHWKQGYTPKAMEYFTKCLEIQRRISGQNSIDTVITLNNIGNVLKEDRQYHNALQYFQKAQWIQQRIRGQNHIDSAYTLNNIGSLHWKQCHYELALKNFKKCLQIQKTAKGQCSPDVASALNNIGEVYNDQEDYLKAIAVFKQSYHIFVELHRTETVEAAIVCHNMGSTFWKISNFPEAIEYLELAYKIKLQLKRKDSIDVALTLNNLGLVYSDIGDSSKAVEYLSECLDIQQKIKGKDSLEVALTLNNLGCEYSKECQYDKAEECFSRSQKIYQKHGNEDYALVPLFKNRGLLFQAQKQYEKAIEYFKQCLQIVQKIYGQNSRKLIPFLNCIGLAFKDQNKYPEAIQYLESSLEIGNRAPGEKGYDVATTFSNLAQVYQDQGDYKKAEESFNRCLSIQVKLGTVDNILVASTHNSIGLMFEDQGDYLKAMEEFKKALEIQQKVLGKTNFPAIDTLNNLGTSAWKNKEYQISIEYFTQCLAIQKELKGENTLDLATTLNNIGLVFNDQNNHEKALESFLAALKIQETHPKKKSFQIGEAVLSNIALVYKNKGGHQKQIQYLEQCLDREEEHAGKGSLQTTTTLNSLGLAHLNQEELDKGLDCFRRCLSILQSCNQTSRAAVMAGNVGFCLQKLNRIEQLRELAKRYNL